MRATLASRASALQVAGRTLGMSRTVVTPPATAAREPCAQSSLCAKPGSRKCTWASTAPGSTRQPLASSRRGPQAAAAPASAAGTTAAMRPPDTSTSAGSTASGVTTVPPHTASSTASAPAPIRLTPPPPVPQPGAAALPPGARGN
jgi:hypothetical protein